MDDFDADDGHYLYNKHTVTPPDSAKIDVLEHSQRFSRTIVETSRPIKQANILGDYHDSTLM